MVTTIRNYLLLFLLIIISGNSYALTGIGILDKIIKTENELNNLEDQYWLVLDLQGEKVTRYIRLISLYNDFKKYDLDYIDSLHKKIYNNSTLSGSEICYLSRIISLNNKIFQKIIKTTEMYHSEKHSAFSTEHLIWVSGHLLILDHIEELYNVIYATDANFRRILKSALIDKESTNEESTVLNELLLLNKSIVELGKSKKFAQEINFIRLTYVSFDSVIAPDLSTKIIMETIINGKSAGAIASGTAKFHDDTFSIIDSARVALDKTLGFVSQVFGNIAGNIKYRKGRFYNNRSAIDPIQKTLRPMDILLEKSPFVLSDKFIPGYFGHVAIYLGTKAQLEEINMWNHPDIIPYQSAIESGQVILEAIRPGVELNTIEQFMNIDELLIMRQSDVLVDPILLSEKISRGMAQIGKKYDFNFDISTLDKIVCSELIYIVFGNVNWPTEYRLGTPTISPDNIAEILFYKNTKFDFLNFKIANRNKSVTDLSIETLSKGINYEKIDDHYRKVITKCHTVTSGGPRSQTSKRVCNTTYAEYEYQENYN